MKHYYLLAIITFFIFASCNKQAKDDNQISTELINNPISSENGSKTSELPVMKFDKIEYDFGAIIQGEKVSHTYIVKNTGKSDLIITKVKASCGCTVPKYDKMPIPAGKSGEIEVVFDSSGRSGIQHKTITVLANTQPNTVTLRFYADIIVPNK